MEAGPSLPAWAIKVVHSGHDRVHLSKHPNTELPHSRAAVQARPRHRGLRSSSAVGGDNARGWEAEHQPTAVTNSAKDLARGSRPGRARVTPGASEEAEVVMTGALSRVTRWPQELGWPRSPVLVQPSHGVT